MRCAKICVIIVVCAIALYALWIVLNRPVKGHFSTPDLAKASIGLTLPKNAKLLHASEYIEPLHFQRMSVIQYGNPDITGLIAQLKTRKMQLSRTDKLGMNNAVDYPQTFMWWDPDSSKKFLAARDSFSRDLTIMILISLDNPKQPIIYIYSDYIT